MTIKKEKGLKCARKKSGSHTHIENQGIRHLGQITDVHEKGQFGNRLGIRRQMLNTNGQAINEV